MHVLLQLTTAQDECSTSTTKWYTIQESAPDLRNYSLCEVNLGHNSEIRRMEQEMTVQGP